MSAPRTRYTRSNGIGIACQVVGDGPQDLVYVPGFVSDIEVMWDDPDSARFMNSLASFARLIEFDKRGTGVSDAVPLDKLPTPRTTYGRCPGCHGRCRLGTSHPPLDLCIRC